MKTPAEAAYLASDDRLRRPFSRLPLWEQKHWEGIADAVIAQSKTIIAEEMAKAMNGNDSEMEKLRKKVQMYKNQISAFEKRTKHPA